jgi:hypothetical protein
VTVLKIIWGVATVACLAGTIWLLVIGLWQAAIPLGALTGIFGFMTVRDILKAAK